MSFRPRPRPPVPDAPAAAAAAPEKAAAPAAEADAAPRPPHGTAQSPLAGAPIVSWGLRGLDAALAGGLPLGSLTVLQPDAPTAYHRTLLSHAVAEGLACAQPVLLCSLTHAVGTAVAAVPPLADPSSPAGASARPTAPQSPAPDLRIAWRYADSRARAAADPAKPGARRRVTIAPHAFDLAAAGTAPVSHPLLTVADARDAAAAHPLRATLRRAAEHLDRHAGAVTRVIVHGARSGDDDGDLTLPAFLSRLRMLMRRHGGVAVVSLPATDGPEAAKKAQFRAVRSCVDAALQLDSFGGRGAAVAGLGSEWHAVLVVRKSVRDAGRRALPGRGDVWVLKRGRRRVTMERATAAPDDEETSSSKPDSGAGSAAALACGSGGGSKNPDGGDAALAF